jgi:hypothetical protein
MDKNDFITSQEDDSDEEYNYDEREPEEDYSDEE